MGFWPWVMTLPCYCNYAGIRGSTYLNAYLRLTMTLLETVWIFKKMASYKWRRQSCSTTCCGVCTSSDALYNSMKNRLFGNYRDRATTNVKSIWSTWGCCFQTCGCSIARWWCRLVSPVLFHLISQISCCAFFWPSKHDPNIPGVGKCPILGILDITWNSSHLVDH